MKDLKIEQQGVKGGNNTTKKCGYVMITANGDKLLSVDNFTGFNETYVQRNEPQIRVYDENNELIFEGTHNTLISVLKK